MATDYRNFTKQARTEFEQQWHERFVEFAEASEDDAGIAGWSVSGLATRLRSFRRNWSGAPPQALYLDVGCGAGTYSRWLAGQGVRVVGLDYSQPTLIKARARTPPSVALCAGDAKRMPFPNAIFDGALCFGVLQAVSDSNSVMRELARILKPGGNLWIDALNSGGLAARMEKARLQREGKEMHLRYETPDNLATILREANFEEEIRYWLPIVPARMRGLQPIADSRPTRFILSKAPLIGALLSHSFVFRARRLGDR